MELDAEEPGELLAVLRFERGLRRRKRRPTGVVDEIEAEGRTRPSEPERVEPLERVDAARKRTATPLAVDVVLPIARQAGDNLDALSRKELRQVLVARFEEHRQVAAVDDLASHPTGFGHQQPEARVHLRGAPRQIEHANGRVVLEQIEDPLCDAGRHDLLPCRSGLHVAVMAGEVAQPSHVDLKRGYRPASQLGQAGDLERGRERGQGRDRLRRARHHRTHGNGRHQQHPPPGEHAGPDASVVNA